MYNFCHGRTRGVLHLREIFRVNGDTLRPFVCGPEVDKYGQVGTGQTSNTSGVLEIFALVMQSSHPDSLPHKVKVTVGLTQPRNVQKTWCSCLAGLDRVVASMFLQSA